MSCLNISEVEDIPKIPDDICERCKARNSLVLDFQNGEKVCRNCGLVAEDRIIDDTYEKRNFGSENGGNRSESRIGGPMKAGEGANLGSNLIKMSKDGSATKAKTGGGSFNQSPIERNYEEITKILSNKDVSKNVIEETKNIYGQVIKELKMKGRNFRAMICAMYFIASRKKKMSKSFKEISSMFNVDETKIKKSYNYIKSVVVSCMTPEQLNDTLDNYIRTFCDSNNEGYEYKKLAIQIAKNINESSILEGRNTKTITGLALFIAMKLVNVTNVNQSKICEEFVSENTLNNVYKKLVNEGNLDKVLPLEYKGKI